MVKVITGTKNKGIGNMKWYFLEIIVVFSLSLLVTIMSYAEKTGLTLVSVRAISANTVEVEFSEPVEKTSAETLKNYSVNKRITIMDAILEEDSKIVRLITSRHSEGVTYTLTANNVKDQTSTPKTIESNSKMDYIYSERYFKGFPFKIPGKIECEDFDKGGERVAYHDTTGGNSGNIYRLREDVDISACTDEGGGYFVAGNPEGEWVEYTVDVLANGIYTIEVRLSANGKGGTFHIEFGGIDKTGKMQVPDTGGIHVAWETISKSGVSLDAGLQIMRFVSDSNHTVWDDYCGCMNYINIKLEGSVQPTIVVTSPNGRESWKAGSEQTVTWRSTGTVKNVDIDLSTNRGKKWTNLISNTANDSKELITVPDVKSKKCQIRVSEVDDSPSDVSDSNFTILPVKK